MRQLQKHDYFGEISLIYDSVRTATVTCTNYCTLGKVGLKTLHTLCANHISVRKALMSSISTYNDQLLVFLCQTLRDVPYLADAKEETILNLVLTMKQDYLEPGAIYFVPGDYQDCMTIIQDGQMNLVTELDTGTQMTVEVLRRGAVIGANKMLILDQNSVRAECISHVIIYTIERKIFTQLASRDSELMIKLIKYQDDLMQQEIHDNTLDFVQIKREIILPTGKILRDAEAERASVLSLKLKNVILQMLHKARETRKVPKLKEILKQAIEQKNRVKVQKRKLMEIFENPRNLLFSSIKPSLNSNQFEMVHEQTAKIGKAIEHKNNLMDQLSKKLEVMLAPP